MGELCPRCKNPGFVRAYVEKGHCWWCSQETMTTICVGASGCGMRVCEPCLSGKLKKPLSSPSPDHQHPSQEEFSI
jgi:hypothetical protein